MTTILLLKFLHLLGFVYWLGGDLGTFYASRFVADESLDTSARATAFKIMMGCDQAPRLCMPLILGLGVQLSWSMGLMASSVIAVIGLWLMVAVWLGMVATIHFGHGKPWLARLQRVDWWFRVMVIILFVAIAVQGLLGEGLFRADWLSWKLLVFAALVGCGLMVRRSLADFIPAWVQLMSGSGDASINATLRKSIMACRPWVYAIWAGLLFNAAVGMHLIRL